MTIQTTEMLLDVAHPGWREEAKELAGDLTHLELCELIHRLLEKGAKELGLEISSIH